MQLRALRLMRMHSRGHQRLAPQFRGRWRRFLARIASRRPVIAHAPLRAPAHAPEYGGGEKCCWHISTSFMVSSGSLQVITIDCASSAPAERSSSSCVASPKIDFVAIFAHQVDRADIAFKHGNTHFIGHQQAPNHLTKNARSQR